MEQLSSNNSCHSSTNKNSENREEYERGFKVDEMFLQSNLGLETDFDKFLINNTKNETDELLLDLNTLNASEILTKHQLNSKNINKIEKAVIDIRNNKPIITSIDYRPFDFKYTLYTGVSNGIMIKPNAGIMQHMLKQNIALLTCRKQTSFDFQHAFISNKISERCSVSLETGEETYIFPLYLYQEINRQQSIEQNTERKPNLNPEIIKQIAYKLGLQFIPEKNSPPLEGCPQDGVANKQPPKPKILTTINNSPIYRNFVENLPHNPALKQLAKDKRKEGILSEVLFWLQVHKGKFHKIDFDRQRIIGNYIVDFYVKTLGLVIEIDGSSHDNKQEYDAKRQAYLENLGLKVFRCTDIDVKKNIKSVITALEDFISEEFGKDTTPAFSHSSKGGDFSFFAPIDILDYIYAVLHSPSYRKKYKEFLKIDFPRVPYPKDKQMFWKLVKLGGEIRQIHLLESPRVEDYITTYEMAEDAENDHNVITTKIGKKDWEIIDSEKQLGRIWINESKYFDKVPVSAWELHIGGYQPAQKWLKDRKEKELKFEDILHYQKIIVALSETLRLMKEIDKISIIY